MEYGLGCLEGKKDLRDYTLKKDIAMATALPEEFQYDKTVEIKSQGSVGSCVAHSASEILEYFQSGKVKLSTNFIYGIHNKLYGSEGPGMYLREACKIVKEYGDPEYEYCPGNNEVKSVYLLAEQAFENDEVLENAKKYKIDSYVKLNTDYEIKYALLNYGPVLSAVMWYSDNRCNSITGVLNKGSNKAGGHAIVIIGWNDKGFICQNSWGRLWGNGGYFILPYNYGISEAYAFVSENKVNEIKKVKTNKVTRIIFKILNVILNCVINLLSKLGELIYNFIKKFFE